MLIPNAALTFTHRGTYSGLTRLVVLSLHIADSSRLQVWWEGRAYELAGEGGLCWRVSGGLDAVKGEVASRLGLDGTEQDRLNTAMEGIEEGISPNQTFPK